MQALTCIFRHGQSKGFLSAHPKSMATVLALVFASHAGCQHKTKQGSKKVIHRIAHSP